MITGRKIAEIRLMTAEEAENEGWECRERDLPYVIILDNKIMIYAARDPEGNGPGCLIGVNSDRNMNFYVMKDY